MGVRPRHSRHREETAPPAGSDSLDICLARTPDESGTAPREQQAHTRAHHAVAFAPPRFTSSRWSRRPRVALDLSAVHDAAAARIKRIAPMHGAAIVPEDEIAHPPHMLPGKLPPIDDAP